MAETFGIIVTRRKSGRNCKPGDRRLKMLINEELVSFLIPKPTSFLEPVSLPYGEKESINIRF